MGRLKYESGGANLKFLNPTHCTAHSDITVSRLLLQPIKLQNILNQSSLFSILTFLRENI